MTSAATLSVSAWLAMASAPLPARQQTFAQKYVTVVGLEGRPVTGLGSEDFSLRDGAIRRPVQAAEPATQPVAVAVLIGGFDAADAGAIARAVDELRRTLKTAGAGHQVQIVEAAGRQLIDAALEACDWASAAATDRRVVLALLRRQAGDGGQSKAERLTDRLRAGRVGLWTLEVAPAGGRKPSGSALDDALTAGTQIGGGLRETFPAAGALPEHAARVASLLLSQYVVTYAWPDPMIGQFSISTRHDRGTVLSPVWDR